MDVKIETVTPERAEAWLNANKNNRKLRDGVVEQYQSDMEKGCWTQCTAPIAFYEDGDLADGQHRLFAVVYSGKSQRFSIMRGLKREDGLNIDTGLTRTVVDNGRISGMDHGLSNELVAIARAVHMGSATAGRMSNAEKLAIVSEHREAAQWAVSNGPKGKNIRNSVVQGAIARAWYWEPDKDKLRWFCDVLSDGFSQGDHESAAVCLRNYMLERAGVASSSAMWVDTFYKAQAAIQKFMHGHKLTVIRKINEEAYPLKKKRNIRK